MARRKAGQGHLAQCDHGRRRFLGQGAEAELGRDLRLQLRRTKIISAFRPGSVGINDIKVGSGHLSERLHSRLPPTDRLHSATGVRLTARTQAAASRSCGRERRFRVSLIAEADVPARMPGPSGGIPRAVAGHTLDGVETVVRR